jgi:ATP-dependent phosphoenolpyruvate carboxykinase
MMSSRRLGILFFFFFSPSSLLSSAAYPLSFIDNLQPNGRGGHASSVVMLTCDAFGVLPAISKLTPEQAEYWFLLGYTAKVAGTEKGVDGVQATFSTCFGQVSLSWAECDVAAKSLKSGSKLNSN